jgi:hypothetical protein
MESGNETAATRRSNFICRPSAIPARLRAAPALDAAPPDLPAADDRTLSDDGPAPPGSTQGPHRPRPPSIVFPPPSFLVACHLMDGKRPGLARRRPSAQSCATFPRRLHFAAMSRQRKPWPIKWIVLAIALFIGPYTYIMLHYRKPGRAYEPYHDMKERANTMRLLNAGFHRVTVEARRPSDPVRIANPAPVSSAPGGLPAALRDPLVEIPNLPTTIGRVVAGATANALLAYPIEFTCTSPDNQEQLGGAQIYLRGAQIYITPDFEHLGGDLRARSPDSVVLLTIAAGTVKPGRYHVILIGEKSSKAWTLQVH